MSFHVYMKVVESDLSPSTSRVAEVYALFANEQNNYAGSCSADWLAYRTKQSESTVRVAIRELRTMGFLETLGVDPKYQTKIYRVHPEVLVARPPYVAPETYGRPKKGGVTEIPPFDADVKGGVTDQQVLQKGGVTVTPKKEADSPEKKEAENTNYVSITGDEKPSPDTTLESISTVTVSDSDAVKEPLAGTLHNAILTTTPDLATLVTESPPVKRKTPKATNPKPPKLPKEPREMNERDLAFLEKITQLNPLIAPDVEKRLGMYRRSNPWSVTQIFLLTGIWPNKNNWNAITSINGVAFDTEKLVTCLDEWTSHGWNPKNLAWVLQWYKFGIPAQYSKNNQQQAVSAPTKPKIESDDPLVMNFAQWIAAKPGYGSKSPYSIKLSAWLATNGDYDVAAQHIGDIEELHADYLAEKG